MRTHYTVPKLHCPYAKSGFCGREGDRGFIREDYRKEHVRKVHPRGGIGGSYGSLTGAEGHIRTPPVSNPSDPRSRSREDESVTAMQTPTGPYAVERQHVGDQKLLVEAQERPIIEERGNQNLEDDELSTAVLPQRLQSLLRVIMTIPSDQLWMEKNAQSSLFNRLKLSVEENHTTELGLVAFSSEIAGIARGPDTPTLEMCEYLSNEHLDQERETEVLIALRNASLDRNV